MIDMSLFVFFSSLYFSEVVSLSHSCHCVSAVIYESFRLFSKKFLLANIKYKFVISSFSSLFLSPSHAYACVFVVQVSNVTEHAIHTSPFHSIWNRRRSGDTFM